MSDSTEGAGPALAAHSKDASTPGRNPASKATGEPAAPSTAALQQGSEAAQRLLHQAGECVRAQPLTSMAMCVAAGMVAGILLGRR